MALDKESFKQAFKDTQSSQERANLILQNADLLKPDLAPITKKLKNGYKVTYYVGKKDVSVGDFPIAMDPHTAEELANKWSYWLPTNKIVDDIHEAAYKGDKVVKPSLLSSSGYYDSNLGKDISPEEVAANVSRQSAIVEFANRIEEELKRKNIGDDVSVTNGKILIAPTHPIDPSEENLPVFFKGIPVSYFQNADGTIEVSFAQGGKGKSPHVTSKQKRYAEYCTFARMVGDKVEVEAPDGSMYSTTYSAALKDPKIASAFTNTPGQEILPVNPQPHQINLLLNQI